MGAPHMVMKHWDPMVGCDFHLVTIPPAPPAGPSPYFTMSFVSGLYIFFKPLWKQVTLYGASVEKGTDIGGGIPHIGPPSVDLALTIAFSASKSHFGASSYQVQGKTPALALAIAVNPNLNCGMPVPTPTGAVICVNTHMAGMSWADVLGGFGSMLGDAAVQTALNLLGLKFGKAFDGKTGLLGLVGSYGWTAISIFVGGPMGPDIGTFGGYKKDQKGDAWTPGGMVGTFFSELGENTGTAVGDYLDGKPAHLPEIPDIRVPTKPQETNIPNVTSNSPFDN